jgi:hypothetical protein
MYLGYVLSNRELNGVCTELDGGEFRYKPDFGTELSLGTHRLELHYRVNDKYRDDYEDCHVFTYVTVQEAHLPTLVWEEPKAIPYNTPLSLFQLNAECNVKEGFMVYNPPRGAILEAGEKHILKGTFHPDDHLHWLSTTTQTTIYVYKADPVLVWEPHREFYAGMALSDDQLNCYTSEIHLTDGVLSYKPGLNAILVAGTHTLTATFKVPKQVSLITLRNRIDDY